LFLLCLTIYSEHWSLWCATNLCSQIVSRQWSELNLHLNTFAMVCSEILLVICSPPGWYYLSFILHNRILILQFMYLTVFFQWNLFWFLKSQDNCIINVNKNTASRDIICWHQFVVCVIMELACIAPFCILLLISYM
jgi:hypothetical protein